MSDEKNSWDVNLLLWSRAIRRVDWAKWCFEDYSNKVKNDGE